MARTRLSKPDSGLGLHTKVLGNFLNIHSLHVSGAPLTSKCGLDCLTCFEFALQRGAWLVSRDLDRLWRRGQPNGSPFAYQSLVVPRRARILDSHTFARLNSSLESNKEEEDKVLPTRAPRPYPPTTT